MGVNKVVYNGKDGARTLIDLTGDSVTPETLAKGVTAHDASGNVINGILSPEDGEDGVGISNAAINSSGHLVLTYTDGNVVDVGKVVGSNGKDGTNGVTPTIKAAAGSNIGAVGTPSVTASTSGTTTTFTFNNLKGASGTNGDIGYYVKATVDRPNFTEANWTTYGTVGREENWGSTSNSGFRVGDLFFVCGTSTDAGKGHLLVYKYTGVKGGSTLSGVCLGHHIISARGANATTTSVATTTTNGLMSAADKVKLNNAVEYIGYGDTIDVGTIISTAGEMFICPGGEMLYVHDWDHAPVCMANLIDAVRACCDELGISAFSSSYSLRRNRSANQTDEPSGEAVEPIEEAVEASGETESSEK